MSATSNDIAVMDPEAAAKLLGWWIDAGVDVAVGEEPRDWRMLATASVASAATAAPVEVPADLFAFRKWLETASGLPLDRGGARRVLPVGAEHAPIMLLADFPGRQEAGEGRPVSGDSWTLASRMLTAIGIAPERAYLATLACFHAPGSKLDGGDLERCAAMARDHVRLAKPERLLLFGDAAARALTGQPLAAARGRVHRIEGVRTVATFHPRWLLQRPSDKALAWKDLILLMSDEG
ncbi:MAG TPA: uracil-DNA glycosylase [Sphingomicrobium sp.]|nr:uracil-DNA glycosylase [Sphingomicrobium sp.]